MATNVPSGVLGEVTHYFNKANVAVIKLKPGVKLKVGAHIHFKGHTTDFDQAVESLEVEHHSVEQVGTGDDFGVKVAQKVREGDQVYAETK